MTVQNSQPSSEIFKQTSAMAKAVENLSCHQEQCDMDGIMVKVSRQALDEVLGGIEAINTLALAALAPDAGSRK